MKTEEINFGRRIIILLGLFVLLLIPACGRMDISDKKVDPLT